MFQNATINMYIFYKFNSVLCPVSTLIYTLHFLISIFGNSPSPCLNNGCHLAKMMIFSVAIFKWTNFPSGLIYGARKYIIIIHNKSLPLFCQLTKQIRGLALLSEKSAMIKCKTNTFLLWKL